MSIPKYEDNKPSETDYAYDAKVVYCKKKLQDPYNELTVKHFADNFEQMLIDVDFEWKHHTKGKPRYPSDKQISNHWFKNHKWKENAMDYCNKELQLQKEEAQLVYDKKYLPDTIADFKKIDGLNKRHKILESAEERTGLDYTYKKAKIEDEISSIWGRIITRLGLDEQNLNVNMNSTNDEEVDLTSEEKERIQNVSSKPDKETQKFLEEIGYESGL